MPAENVGVKFLAAAIIGIASATGLTTVHYGAPPPSFMVPTPQGAEPLSHFRGKPVVINFWASWCPPCTDELPYFERVRQSYGDRVTVITVSNEAPGVAEGYLRQRHIDLPLVEDPSGKIFSAYKIPPIPDTVVLDSGGNVSYVSAGGLSWPELQTAVDRVLAVPAPVSAQP
jgi:thiol-disulfide isomerase/thioredoxin